MPATGKAGSSESYSRSKKRDRYAPLETNKLIETSAPAQASDNAFIWNGMGDEPFAYFYSPGWRFRTGSRRRRFPNGRLQRAAK